MLGIMSSLENVSCWMLAAVSMVKGWVVTSCHSLTLSRRDPVVPAVATHMRGVGFRA